MTTKRSQDKIKSRLTQMTSPSCRDCPLDKAVMRHPKLPATGATRPAFYFLGKANGKTEDEEGEQFLGEPGRMVRFRIPSQWSNKIRWNNTINCLPAGDEEPSAQELMCCRSRVIADIEKSRPAIVVGFGEVPLNWVLGTEKKGGQRKIAPWRGRKMPVKIGKHVCWFYPIDHPEDFLNRRRSNSYDARMRTFENDLRRIFSDYAVGLPTAEVETDFLEGIRTVEDYTRQGFGEVLLWLRKMAKLKNSTIDIETNELRPYNETSRILSVAIGTYEETVAFPLEHSQARWSKSQLRQIYSSLEEYLMSPGTKCAHFSKFEITWLIKQFGHKIAHDVVWEDTAAMAHVLDERKGKSLEALTEIYFGFNVKKLSPIDASNLDATDLSSVLPYNALDTKWTDALRRILKAEIEERGLTEVYRTVNQVTPSFAMMQDRGVHRNLPVIDQFSRELIERKESVLSSIAQDPDVKRFVPTNKDRFKPTSNPDLQHFFRDFLKVPHPNQGRRDFKYSLTEDILEKFDHPVAKMILDMRTTSGNLSKYVVPLLSSPSDVFPDGGRYVKGDGLAHADFNQLITSTGRPACEDPPLQQWPKREHREIRRVICAPPGHDMVSVDFGQLEARIIATLSRDPVLCEEIFEKYDIHGDWTDRLGTTFDRRQLKDRSSRKHLRDSTKVMWTFPLFYGSTLESVAHNLSTVFKKDIHPSTLETHYQAFWDKYRVVLDWQEKLESFYWKHGYVETAFGFRRHEPLSKNELINSPVQGTAGQLVMLPQVKLSKASYTEDKPQYQPVINMHDDLTFYLPHASLENDIERIARDMCCFDLGFLVVPLSVEVSLGPNWADQQEIGTFYSTDFGWKPPIQNATSVR